MKTNIAQARDVAERTQDAFSYDAYTPSGWRACCVMLAKRGYNQWAIEAIMRSKWTRWAGDGDEKRGYGHYNGKTLERFMDNMIQHSGEAETDRRVRELVSGTFRYRDRSELLNIVMSW